MVRIPVAGLGMQGWCNINHQAPDAALCLIVTNLRTELKSEEINLALRPQPGNIARHSAFL